MTIKLIVGLANPGADYVATRHNAGNWYIKLLTQRYQQKLKYESKFHGYIGYLKLGDNNIHLLVPRTFMNSSGTAVAAMANFYSIAPEEILVAHDELDLLPGNVRLKFGGSHSGHKGLKNIISCLDHNSYFYRLRIGIGHPGDKNKVTEFVLGNPPMAELKLIDGAIDEAVNCTVILITQNAAKARNRLHAYTGLVS